MAFGEQIDNLRLEWAARALYDYPLPPDTEVLERRSAVIGETSFCNYQAEIVLATRHSRDEIEHYYVTAVVPSALWTYDAQSRVIVHFDDSPMADGRTRLSVTAISGGDCARW